MNRRTWMVMIGLLMTIVGCAAPPAPAPRGEGDAALRQRMAEFQANRDARARIQRGWEDWNWRTHNAYWEDDVLVLHDGLNRPIRARISTADSVAVRKPYGNWYYEVRVHCPQPESNTFFLRVDDRDEAGRMVQALVQLGAMRRAG